MKQLDIVWRNHGTYNVKKIWNKTELELSTNNLKNDY